MLIAQMSAQRRRNAGDKSANEHREGDEQQRLGGIAPRSVGSRFRLRGMEVICPLAGEHQVQNAVTAVLALRELGTPPEGIAEARWPGRLEFVSPNPDVILDGAHNPAGARALARYLERFYAGQRIWMIYGAMRDKAIEEVAEILFPLAERVIATRPENPRAASPEEIQQAAARTGTQIEAVEDVHEAVDRARSLAKPGTVMVITGSIYLVGEVIGSVGAEI